MHYKCLCERKEKHVEVNFKILLEHPLVKYWKISKILYILVKDLAK